MKRILLALFLFFFSASPTFAASEWVITDFHSDIVLEPSGVVSISESIQVDFRNLEKHGIFRDIPYVYEDDKGNKTYTKIEIQKVIQDGAEAEYKVTRNENNIRVRIGDPDNTISGKNSYLLIYTATGVLRPFSHYDEFYWNVTGNDWEADIERASAMVTVPKEKIEDGACFEGHVGSTVPCIIGGQTSRDITFASSKPLASTEGLTISVGYTKGMVPILTVAPPKSVLDDLFKAPALIAFVFAFVGGIIAIVVLWMKSGRDFWFRTRRQFDPKAKEETMPIGSHEPVVVEFTPPEKLRPAELGVLMDEKADTLDVTATIVDLANRGFLTIKEIEKKWLFGSKDYELHRTALADGKLLPYEKLLLDQLFASGKTIKVSELKTTFYDDLALVKKQLYQDILQKKLFIGNPESIRNMYVGIGFGILVIGGICIGLGIYFILAPLLSFGIGVIIVGIIFLFNSNNMPRRTAYGRELYQRVKGYQLFIGSAEKYRQQFFEKKNMFNEVLPYAIIFGLTGKFAQAMKDMGVHTQNPSWYSGAHVFTPVAFASDVESFSKSLSTAIASTPSSSGGSGGSSGGGFGGGGGGSW